MCCVWLCSFFGTGRWGRIVGSWLAEYLGGQLQTSIFVWKQRHGVKVWEGVPQWDVTQSGPLADELTFPLPCCRYTKSFDVRDRLRFRV